MPVSPNDLALFRAWPALRERLPRRRFVDEPTPVEPFRLEGLPPGRFFVKRDDRCCRLYGGNKPRKLEFILGHALERGAERVVTTGAFGSHHALATSVLARSAGLKTSLVLVPEPLSDEVACTLALDAAHGAELVYAGSVARAGLATAALLSRSFLGGEAPYLIPTGGTSAHGIIGFVSAALELAEQVEAGILPAPAEIWVPVGSGGTVAGLVLGLQLAGLCTRVRGVLVTDILPPSPRRLARLANECLALLRGLAPEIPAASVEPKHFRLDSSELGPGYGVSTPAAAAALEAAAAGDLQLETTYSAKCLAGLMAANRSGELPHGPVLFWNTHNGIELSPSRRCDASPRGVVLAHRRVRGASPSRSGRSGAPSNEALECPEESVSKT